MPWFRPVIGLSWDFSYGFVELEAAEVDHKSTYEARAKNEGNTDRRFRFIVATVKMQNQAVILKRKKGF
jgi:hypothetical protein